MQRFVVPGLPVAKQRPRAGTSPNGNVRIYTPKATKDYERDVGYEAKRAGVRIHGGIVAVTILLFGCSKGDADNYAKCILDGLNGVAWNDDRQVEELHVFVERRAKPARAEIVIRTKGHDEAGTCSYCGSQVSEMPA